MLFAICHPPEESQGRSFEDGWQLVSFPHPREGVDFFPKAIRLVSLLTGGCGATAGTRGLAHALSRSFSTAGGCLQVARLDLHFLVQYFCARINMCPGDPTAPSAFA